MIEQLEDRRLLAITDSFVGGVLDFTGDGADDVLVLNADNAASSSITYDLGGGPVTRVGVTAVNVNLGAGNNSLTINGSAAADTIALNALVVNYGAVPYTLVDVQNLTIDGQAGADTLSATGVTVTGNLALRGGVGAGDNLSVSNLTTGDLEAGDAEAADDVELDLGVTTISGSQQYTSDVTLIGLTTLNATAVGQSIEFDGAIDGAEALAMNSPSVVFNGAVGGAVPLSSVAVGVAGTLLVNGGEVTTSGSQFYTGPVQIGNNAIANTIFTGSSISFDSTVDDSDATPRDIEVNVIGNVTLGGDVGAVNALGRMVVNGEARFAGTAVNTSAAQTYNGAVRLQNDVTFTVSSAELLTFNGTIDSFDATDRALVASGLADGVVIAQPVGLAFDLASIEVNGALALNGALVVTSGDQDYNDPVTLNAAGNLTTLTSNAGSVRFADTLDSFQLNEESLVVNAAVDVAFNGAIGSAANGALSNLDVNSTATVSIGAARIINTADLEALAGQIIDLNGAANNISANSLIATAVTGISLDTTVVNLLASNTTSGGIDISEVDDLSVLLVSAPNQTVTLAAGGAILDGNAAANNIVAASLVASAANGISLDTDITNLVANNSTAGGIDINETDDVNVSTVSAAGQTVTLTAAGALSDTNGAAVNVTAATLVASAATGINLDTTIADLTASNATSGGIDINDTDNLNVLTVSAPGQTVTLSAGGAIIDGNAAAVNIVAASLAASAVTGISLDTTIASLTASNTTSGGIDINESDDLNVLTVSAPGQTVTLAAVGLITDGNGAANNITAASLIVSAATGISLDTTITSISATNSTSGGIDISETDDLNVLGIAAPAQTVALTAGGAITDGNGPAVNVIAATLNVAAVTGITLGTAIDNLTASNSTSGGIAISDNSDLNLVIVLAPGQTASISAAGDLNVNSATAGAVVLLASDAITDINGGTVNVTADSLNATATTGISLDTDIADLTATNAAAGGIDINEADDVNVLTVSAPGQTVTLTAGGAITDGNAGAVNVTATSLVVNAVNGVNLDTTIDNLLANNSTSGGIDINETDDLTVTTVLAAGQTVTLSAGAAILDGNAAAPNVTSDSLIANAVSGISLDTTVANLSASNTTSGNIDLSETDSVSIGVISAPGQTVMLTAGGAITDGNGATSNVTANALLVNAVNGISLDTTIADLTATNTTSGGIDISETDNLTVLNAVAAGQTASIAAGATISTHTVTAATVNLTAGAAISDANAAATNIAATSLVANAVTGITLDTTIANLTATNTTSGGIDISETDDLNVLAVSAPAQLVTLQAGGNLNVTSVNAGTATLIAAGAITDANAAALNVTAGSLNALANDGISLDTAIGNLTATNNTSGDILIREADGLNVVSAVNAAANIQVTSAFGLVTIATVDAAGFFVGSTADVAAAGDNLVVNGTVQANSFISLIAGDDVTLAATSDVKSATSFVYLKVDAATVDVAGGTLLLFGALQGNNALQYPVVAEGDVGDDLFSIQKLPQSPMAILARAGTLDNTFIVFEDTSDQINAFATVVDLVGNPGIEITYVDNEQLDLFTQGGDDKVFVQMPEPTHGILANIIRVSTGAGDDSLKINGSTLNDVIRVNSYTTDGNYRFQVRGDTGETECLQVFGFLGNDVIENSAPIAALLDGGNGADHITGSDFATQPATNQALYDVIFGGADADTLFGRGGNDFLYADFDYNFGAPVQTFANGDLLNSGRGIDVLIALGGDAVTRDPGDFEPDVIVGQNVSLSINDFLFAQLLAPNAANINQQLQAGLSKKCAMPII